MPEIRIDPLTGLRAIVGDGDAPGPHRRWPDVDLAPSAAVPAPDDPLLTPDAADPPRQDNPDLFAALAAHGAHEMLDEPASALAGLPVESAQAALELWRERMRAHEDAAYVHVSLDEDGRSAAVAQLHAFDFVPAAVARERERFGAHAVRTMGGNLLEDLVQAEVRMRARIVAIDAEAVLWCPYASQHPFQLMLAPRRPRERFEDDGPTGAALLHHGLTLLRVRFGESPALSLWVRTAPRGADRFCWRIDVVPRLTRPGGLELGTGLAYNPVAPERVAAQLRELR